MRRRIGINGFGRIGRLAFRALHLRHAGELEIAAINDPAGSTTGALLLEYDSNYGRFPGEIREDHGAIVVDDARIPVVRQRDWRQIDWSTFGIHTVLECSGQGTSRERAAIHLERGARQVIISAPARGDDITIVMGVNHHEYQPGVHQIISSGSCTTNCLAPIVLVLRKAFGLRWGMLSTVHSYTNSQNIHDRATRDPRESRAGALNIIPTETGAARALGRVIPEVQGLFDGIAFRVPTPTVSVVDFVCETERAITKESVAEAFRDAAASPELREIVGTNDRPLVSMDFRGDSRSAIVDLPSTIVIDRRILKVVAWYDNEWGYSCRLADVTRYTARRDRAAGLAEAPWTGAIVTEAAAELEEVTISEI